MLKNEIIEQIKEFYKINELKNLSLIEFFIGAENLFDYYYPEKINFKILNKKNIEINLTNTNFKNSYYRIAFMIKVYSMLDELKFNDNECLNISMFFKYSNENKLFFVKSYSLSENSAIEYYKFILKIEKELQSLNIKNIDQIKININLNYLF